MAGLHILQDLLSKNAPAFEDQFSRLGLQLKIQALAGPPQPPLPSSDDVTVTNDDGVDIAMDTTEKEGESGESKASAVKEEEEEKKKDGEDKTDGAGDIEMELEDATDVVVYTPYQWKEWSIVRSQDCLYMWNEYCSLELSNVSNGWFRFLIDNKLATMYSSGSTEGGPDSFGKI